jgi:hypothetical protein
MENNRFKYRPEVKSIEDLQNGDRFLVGDERWDVRTHVCEDGSGELFMIHNNGMLNYNLHRDFIRANVPIERDIPYPEGGAEKWELREFEVGEPLPRESLYWRELGNGSAWARVRSNFFAFAGTVYAIPKAPKEYTVMHSSQDCGVIWVEDFKPGDRVTVQGVSEQGEGT